jgi:hypothetical protein
MEWLHPAGNALPHLAKRVMRITARVVFLIGPDIIMTFLQYCNSSLLAYRSSEGCTGML